MGYCIECEHHMSGVAVEEPTHMCVVHLDWITKQPTACYEHNGLGQCQEYKPEDIRVRRNA